MYKLLISQRFAAQASFHGLGNSPDKPGEAVINFIFFNMLYKRPTEFNSLSLRTNWGFTKAKKNPFAPSQRQANEATLGPRHGPLVLAPLPTFPALAVALRGLEGSGTNSVRYFTAMWFAQRRWWLTGGDIEILPRLTRRGFFCLSSRHAPPTTAAGFCQHDSVNRRSVRDI